MTETPTKAAELVVYVPNEATLVEAAEKARGLKIAGVDDAKGYKLVHEKRMQLKGFRVEIEKTRKDLKADALEYGRRVDAEAKRLTALIEPTERELEAEEERIDAEKARIAAEAEAARRKILDDRISALAAVGCQAVPSEVQDMAENEFAELLKLATEEHARKVEAERVAAAERARVEAEQAAARKAEQERLAREEAERRAEEERKQKAERERLAAERVELEKAQAAQRAESDRIAAERKALDDKARAEADKLAAERRAFEKEQAEAARQRALEDARREAAEQAKKETEAAANRAAIEAEEQKKRDAEEAARLEALKPEIERVRVFAGSLTKLAVPEVWCASDIVRVLLEARTRILALVEKARVTP